MSRAERIAADWCRAWGDDHGAWLRRLLHRCIEAEVGHILSPQDDEP